ncbi:MAG: hypothetical protein DWH91_11080 [Planctomycetota bacterium]|nr:MAG: hypothetical protein DWH91_11080 [Planctomycetota bacterium]
MSGFTNADLTVANGTLSPVTSADGGLIWTTTFTPNDQVYAINESLTVSSNQIMDARGNLWVGPLTSSNYSIDTINSAPTIQLTNTINALDENTSTAIRIKVADVGISDDGRGTNTLSLSGADFASFELDGTELFLKAGVLLNYELQSSYAITIQADDATILGVPDATVAFRLDLNNLNEAPIHTGPTTFSFEEFSARWTVVGRLTASDPDGSPLTYSIVSGNPDDTLVIGDGSNPALAGTLWVNRQDLTGLRHRGSFSLRVRVTDNGQIPLSTEFDVKIYITPVTSKSLTILPAVDGQVTQQGADQLLNTDSTQLRIEGGPDWTRSVLEFDLSTIPEGKVLKDAWLFFETTSIEGTASPDFLPIEIYGYAGDGVVDVSDASRGSLIGSRPLHHLSSTNQLKVHSASLDPAYVRTLVGTGTLGLVLRNEGSTYATTLNAIESSASASAKPYLILQLADPQPDLIIHDPGAFGTGHEILILDSQGSRFTATIAANLFEATPWERFFTGDFNADGHTDIAGLQADGSWWVSLTSAEGILQTATLWNTGDPGGNWSNILVADFDGNGCADIAARSNDGNWTVLVSTGNGFTNSVWGQWSTSGSWSNVLSADFNRDGRGDLAGRNELGEWYVSLSMGDGTMTTSKWGQWSTTTTWSDVQVGDFNGDGRADIIGRSTIGQWWVSVVATSNFSTFLADTWTGPQSQWSEVTVGDFNSDGKADLAARSNLTNEVWTSLGNQGRFTTSVWATLPNLDTSLWRILNSGSLF